MPEAEAVRILENDGRNKEVLFPYLDGDDLNGTPDCSAKRWVINFHNWPEARAKEYKDCYGRVLRLVKPQRAKNADRKRREIWWQFTRPTIDLYSTISDLDRIIAVARVSSTVIPVVVPSGQVFHEKIVVFASGNLAQLAVLTSAIHYFWVAKYTTRHGGAGDITYAHKSVFETFPFPDLTTELFAAGGRLHDFRRDVMLSRGSGLTKTYNDMVFASNCRDADIEELRRIHQAIDEATIRAYGWEDRIDAVGGLDHGFHNVGRETRYTIGPAAQREILDSLLELNHERYAEEGAQGLHDKKKRKSTDEGTLF